MFDAEIIVDDSIAEETLSPPLSSDEVDLNYPRTETKAMIRLETVWKKIDRNSNLTEFAEANRKQYLFLREQHQNHFKWDTLDKISRTKTISHFHGFTEELKRKEDQALTQILQREQAACAIKEAEIRQQGELQRQQVHEEGELQRQREREAAETMRLQLTLEARAIARRETLHYALFWACCRCLFLPEHMRTLQRQTAPNNPDIMI